MKALLKLRPDLRACELEDRLLPASPNVGSFVLMPFGYVLITPFPGAAVGIGGGLGGAAIPPAFIVTGSGGISSMQPGNSTGVPGLATPAPTGSNGGAAATISVGSGANDASAPIIDLVTRNTIANDALNAAPVIGRVSGDRSAVLSPGQVYRSGLPETAAGGVSTEVSGQRAAQDPGQGPIKALPTRLQSRPHRP
jgi:hypothetical protein